MTQISYLFKCEVRAIFFCLLKIFPGKYRNGSWAHDEAVVDARVFAVRVAVAAVFVAVGVDA